MTSEPFDPTPDPDVPDPGHWRATDPGRRWSVPRFPGWRPSTRWLSRLVGQRRRGNGVPWWERDSFLPEPGWLRRSWRPLGVISLLVASVATFEVWLGTCGFAGCPTAAEIRAYEPTEGGRILDRAGNELGQLRPIQRINVPLASVPEHVRHAFLATEDRRFYEHDGVDPRGVLRATVRNITALGVREGFSTISMQVARNTFLAERFHYSDRSLRKKLLELRVAGLLERNLTKDRIFELYLNAVYLGNGTYGVEAAARDLFGRSVEHLTPDEGAMLAALPKGPSSYTPRRSLERAKARRDLVLGLMAREGYLTPEDAERYRQRPLEVAPPDRNARRYGNSFALDAVRQLVDSLTGGNLAKYPDLVVHTTIDAAAQRAAERAVARQAAVIQRRVGQARTEQVQGAFVALSPADGDVLALVGGREYVRRGFNRALAARRQPGSAFKPFVYAAALERGFTPASLVEDAPVEVVRDGRVWRPANADGRYLGAVTLRRALARSSNTAAVRITQAVGEQRVVQTARRNGVASRLEPVPSIALGSLEVTPIELVAAYAPFANGGIRVEPHLIERIETKDGRVLWQHRDRPVRVMDERDAFLLTSMLQSVVDEGTATVLRARGVRGPVAGKTGTTNDGTDVWFVGYTPTVVAGVWFGFDTPRSLGRGAAGGSLAAPAWAEFYREAWARHDDGDGWPVPDGIVRRVVDPSTGLLADDWCPERRVEWFKEGTEPTELSDCWYWETPYETGDDRGGNWLRDFRNRLRDVFRIPRQAPPPPETRRRDEDGIVRERARAEREARREVARAEREMARQLEREREAMARELARVRRQLERDLERAGMDDEIVERVVDALAHADPTLQRRVAELARLLAGGQHR